MSKNQRNVPISLLLDLTNDDNDSVQVVESVSPSKVNSLVSQFQPSIEVNASQPPTLGSRSGPRSHRNLLNDEPTEIIAIDEDDDQQQKFLAPEKKKPSKPKKPVLSRTSPSLPMLIPKPINVGSVSPSPQVAVTGPTSITPGPGGFISNEQIKQFQSSFQVQHSTTPTPVQANSPVSKTSINSIINVDDEPEETKADQQQQQEQQQPPKKKRAPAKKRKAPTPAAADKPPTEAKKRKPAAKPKADGDKKPAAKTKKKTPETKEEPVVTKTVVHPTMTTDKLLVPKEVLLPPAQIIEVEPMPETKPDTQPETKPETKPETQPETKPETKPEPKPEPKAEEKEKAKEPPIIALNIPLLDPKDPKPGQSEVVINVLKLAEDKYGWSAIHPNAKSAIDLMDEMIDDEEDIEEEDDDDVQIADRPTTPQPNGQPKTKKKDEEELTEEQLVRQHEVKMNRKVGKYDYEDPFIDDEELQWEEEITSTKEGFFVYWGPLVDDRSMTSGGNKKGASKGKK